MRISHVVLNNFKPYYGDVFIDLSTRKDKNVVLIGGRNGQGKTSFLVGIVWCLYGGNISTIDKVFKDEVKGNYTKFLTKALNKAAYSEGETIFSVEVGFEDVELSEVFTKKEQKTANIVIRRSYDVSDPASKEEFEILMDGKRNALLSDETDKTNFINDYLIPIELAKFVFFDAEKIAEIAQLGAKDQASLMDEAFGQVLGLNTYENLIDDLQQYEKGLQKQDASGQLSREVSSYENAIKLNDIKSDEIEEALNNIEERIEELNSDITDLTNQLIRRGDTSVKIDIDELRRKELSLKENQEDIAKKFHEVAELISFAIMAHKLEEVNDHIQKEEEIKLSQIERKALSEKTKEFAELLFNKSPFPESDIDMEQKLFYYKKAKGLLSDLYNPHQKTEELDFIHDLDKSDINHIQEVYNLVKSYSKNIFENTFNEYMRIQNDYQEVYKELKRLEASSKDEFIQEIQDKKKNAEREKTNLQKEYGALESEKIRLQKENDSHRITIERTLKRVKVSKEAEKKIKIIKKYVKVLSQFVREQKEKKIEILESTLIEELSKLLNKKGLVENVEIIIHKNKLGLEVKLYDDKGNETSPTSDMSKGEQQLYISALLKAILAESIHELPVLIDTPLGRLDQEHRDNILKYYYPYLSSQVIIFSTNTEIRISDTPKIENFLARTYRLENNNKRTLVHSGYFK